jgi:xanthine dehydrogenase accessory factor
MKKHIYQTAYELLSSGKKIILAKIIRRSGSTPRDVGAMCIVSHDITNNNKEIFGTIGGGLMEYQVMVRCHELIEQGKSAIFQFRLTQKDLAASGMICGGEVDLYLDCLFPENPETMSVFKAASEEIEKNLPATMITRIKDNTDAYEIGIRKLIREDNSFVGTVNGFNPQKSSLLEPGQIKEKPFAIVNTDQIGLSFFVEKIHLNSRLFLFGAGHVSVFVARLARTVGFEIIIIDDRPEFANKERFPEADEIIVSKFDLAFDKVEITKNSYIVIVTRGHINDKAVLERALNTQARYIGMIGSKRKRNIIYKKLIEQGFSKERLEEVYSPIGLEIGAETPEEIAVSIIAELIKIRASILYFPNVMI